MISVAQAQQYLDQALGVGVPAFLVSAAVEAVEAAEPAMVATPGARVAVSEAGTGTAK